MKRVTSIFFMFAFSISISNASDFKTTVDSWQSHQDVADWLKGNWTFDQAASNKIQRGGPSALRIKSAEDTFEEPKGWCKDAAKFAKDTLNQVDSSYNAEYIFIENKVRKAPNHWVAGFKSDGKIYIIDYGAGSHWKQMMGVHGPYSSLDEYSEFLASLNLRNFKLDFVKWIPDENEDPATQMAKQRAIVILGKFDKNGDDRISLSEAPRRMKKNYRRLDKNGDKLLDEGELFYLPPR